MNGNGPGLRLNVVWNGRLQEPVDLRRETLPADIDKALAGCHAAEIPGAAPVAVHQNEVDTLLAVRRWFKETKGPEAVIVTATGPHHVRNDAWAEQLLAAALRLLDESAI
jgi:hypothetical protein